MTHCQFYSMHPSVLEASNLPPSYSSNSCKTLPSHYGTHSSCGVHRWIQDHLGRECQPCNVTGHSICTSYHVRMFLLVEWFWHVSAPPLPIHQHTAPSFHLWLLVEWSDLLYVVSRLQDQSVYRHMISRIVRASRPEENVKAKWPTYKMIYSQSLLSSEQNATEQNLVDRIVSLLVQIVLALVTWYIHNCMFPGRSYHHSFPSTGCAPLPFHGYTPWLPRHMLDCSRRRR